MSGGAAILIFAVPPVRVMGAVYGDLLTWIDGSDVKVLEFFSLLEPFPSNFNIVTP
jgi:hypothetical protein